MFRERAFYVFACFFAVGEESNHLNRRCDHWLVEEEALNHLLIIDK